MIDRGFHGWRVVAAGTVIQALIAMLVMHAFKDYSVKLEQEFHWSATTLSAAFALNRVESGLLGPIQGTALDRYGPAKVIRIGAVLLAIGLALFATTRNLPQFFLYYFVVAVGASLAGFLSVVTATVAWFERRRATALAISQGGFAIGGMLTPVTVYALDRFGWRATSVASAVIVLVVIVTLSTQFISHPSDIGQFVDGVDPGSNDSTGDASARAEGVSDVHFTASEAVRTKAFWFIALGHGSALLVVGAILAHLSLYLTGERGFSLQRASFVGAALPLAMLAGQLIGGWLGDRFVKRYLTMVAMAGHVFGLLLLANASSDWMIWAFVPLHGLGWGIRGPLMQAMRADYFGSTAFGKIMGYSSMITMFGMMTGPLVAGWSRDSTGSYQRGFTVLALFAALGFVFFFLARPPTPPARPAAVGS